jgi:hypothetical protein
LEEMDLPSDDVLRGIVRTYARLRADHGDSIGTPPLVQPTGEFFPDTFEGDAPSVARLLGRMLALAPVAHDLQVEVAFLAPDESRGPGGCGSLACGSPGAAPAQGRDVEDWGDGYRIFVSAADVPQPMLLATSLARSIGAIVLREAGEEPDEADEATAEIAAGVCGFGVVVLNGTAVWGKSCSGLRMAQATALSVEEAAVLLALFLGVHGLKVSQAREHLGATQREALDLATAWAESNPLLVEALRDRPTRLVAGAVAIEPLRGIVGRWLYKRRVEKELQAKPASPPPMTESQRRRFDEARALVDEVLGERIP